MSDEQSSVPQRGGAATGGPQGGLLAQMDLLMAALNADLSALDAELQGAGGISEASGASGPSGPSGTSGGGCAAEVGVAAGEGSGDGPGV
ncbi:hypothetical protein BIU87_01005 [Streptomyces sp. ZS0098]|uniref:hypothetical protein n=1 Tax=unclassified Streptomyces TaxID=2593676 RepID=UPI000EFC7158|nr:hypothetical protein [Streptomyces sp. ZS0098]RMI91616.1 hypothetical protein BIU87_01005 [Streptomyces sp. ZS0098]